MASATCQAAPRCWLVLLLIVLAAAARPAAPEAAPAKEAVDKRSLTPEYSTVLSAAISKVKFLLQMYTGAVRSGANNDPAMKSLLDMAQDSNAKLTAFLPVDESWQGVAAHFCMTTEQMMDSMNTAPGMMTTYMQDHMINNTVLFSDGFKDGMVLNFIRPGHEQTLRKENGKWVFKNASVMHTDVHVIRTDITAGKAVIHLLDTMFRDDDTVPFMENQKRLSLQQGHNDVCKGDPPPPTLTSGAIAGIVIGTVVGFAVLAAVVTALVLRRRSGSALGGRRSLKGLFATWSGDRSGPGGGHGRDGLGAVPQSPDTVNKGAYFGGSSWAVRSSDSHNTAYETQSNSSMLGATASSRIPASALEGVADGATSRSAGDVAIDMADQPHFEAAPAVPSWQLESWLRTRFSRSAGSGGSGAAAALLAGRGDTASDSDSSSSGEARFAEVVRGQLQPGTGNPSIIQNYTNFVRVVEHASTAVYFAEGMHSKRQYALKFYASTRDFEAEMHAYKKLSSGLGKYVPQLEMSWPSTNPDAASVLVFERGQCTLEDYLRTQRPSYFQQVDIFHQLVQCLSHFHEHGMVHRDMKLANVVHFPEKFQWLVIDLATMAPSAADAPPIYTLEYCSPEVASAVVAGAKTAMVHPASDVWGLGVIMYELATGQRFFPPEWSQDGGRRIWEALCGFTPLPFETTDITSMQGVDRGLMKQVRRLLQRDPSQRPTARQLAAAKLFQARGNTTTAMAGGIGVAAVPEREVKALEAGYLPRFGVSSLRSVAMLLSLSVWELPQGEPEEALAAGQLARVSVRELGTGTPVFVMSAERTYVLQLSFMAGGQPLPQRMVMHGLQIVAPNGSRQTLEVLDRDATHAAAGADDGHTFRALWPLSASMYQKALAATRPGACAAGVGLLAWLKSSAAGATGDAAELALPEHEDVSISADVHILLQASSADVQAKQDGPDGAAALPGKPYQVPEQWLCELSGAAAAAAEAGGVVLMLQPAHA